MHAPNPLAKTLGSWLLLMFALVMSSTAWAQRDDGQYQILQAVYGTDQRSIDVTDRLKQLAARDQRFKLTNDLFNNVDPAPVSARCCASMPADLTVSHAPSITSSTAG